MNNIIDKKELVGIIEQALYSDELAIFAGAGLSIGAGYYSWEELLKKNCKESEFRYIQRKARFDFFGSVLLQ